MTQDEVLESVRTVEGAKALLAKRAVELDVHVKKFPNSLDKSIEITSTAIKTILEELK